MDAITALMESIRGVNPGMLDEAQLTTLLETLLTSTTVHARALSTFLSAYGPLRDVQYAMLQGVGVFCAARREDRSGAQPRGPAVQRAADALPEDDVARNVYDALMCVYASMEPGADREADQEADEAHDASAWVPRYKVRGRGCMRRACTSRDRRGRACMRPGWRSLQKQGSGPGTGGNGGACRQRLQRHPQPVWWRLHGPTKSCFARRTGTT